MPHRKSSDDLFADSYAGSRCRAGFASHEDAMLQVQAAEEAALEENTQTMGYSTGSMEKSITDSVRQRKN